VWILKCASRSAKEENDFGQLEHLKLEGLKIKTILVFCRDQSVFRGSYYGTKHSSKGTEPNSNGTEHHSNDRTLTTAAANTTAAAKATAAVNTTAAARATAAVNTTAAAKATVAVNTTAAARATAAAREIASKLHRYGRVNIAFST
jgi:hypothetical protein